MNDITCPDKDYPDINLGQGESAQSIIARDTHPAPAHYRTTSYVDMGTEDVPTAPYTSRDWFEQEKEKLWRKTWQVACRVEDIPEIGDHYVYDICDDSVIVVRTAPDTFKAYVNACLHKGNALCVDQGHSKEFRCPYHGWTWSLEGKLKAIPGAWDFEHVNRKEFGLPEIRLDTWGGFIFINFNDDCAPLEDYLEILPRHLKSEDFEKRYKAVHVAQVVPCNWKVVMEAFIEGYHVAETHFPKDEDGKVSPDSIAAFTHDTKAQYDTWPESKHINRLIQIDGIPSQYVAHKVDEQKIVDVMLRRLPKDVRPRIEAGERARDVLADFNRKALTQLYGVDMSEASTFDIIDQAQYNVFPNFTIWPTPFAPLCYRFRPINDSPDEALYEMWMLHPIPEDGREYTPMKVRRLGPDELWADVEELGPYGPIVDQDIPNLRRLTKGMKASRKKGNTLGRYQESRIRHYLRTLDEYMTAD